MSLHIIAPLDCGCGCVRVWIFGERVVGVWVSRAVLYIRNCVSHISRKRFVHIVFDKYFNWTPSCCVLFVLHEWNLTETDS